MYNRNVYLGISPPGFALRKLMPSPSLRGWNRLFTGNSAKRKSKSWTTVICFFPGWIEFVSPRNLFY